MALSASDANIRDQVALRLADRAYGDLTADQVTVIGGTNGSVSRALKQIERYAHFFNGDQPASAPDDWAHWLVDLASYEGSLSMRPDLSEQFRRKTLESQQTAITTFTRGTFGQTTATDQMAFTLGSLRLAIMDRAVRRSNPVFPNPSVIDSALDWTIKRIWKDAEWKFTQQTTIININENGTVTYEDEAGNTISSIGRLVGTVIYLNASKGEVHSVDRDTLLRHRSATTQTKGVPRVFHLQRVSGAVKWNFVPEPDDDYTARAITQRPVPSLTDTASFNTALGLMPGEFISVIRDMAFGKMLVDMGVVDGQNILTAAGLDLGGLIDEWDSPGGQPEKSREGVWRPRGLGITGRYLGGGV